MTKAQKGSSFEREICSRLSLWWTNGERDDVFWRTAGSGARATTRGKRGVRTHNQQGDVASVDPAGAPLTDMFVVEIKRGYSKSSIQDVLDRPDRGALSNLEIWINKVKDEASSSGRFWWLLITKRDRREPVVWMDARLLDVLEGLGCVLGACPSARVRAAAEPWVCVFGMRLSDFFEEVRPGTILRMEVAEKC